MIKTKTLLVYSAILNVFFLILLVMINTYDASRFSKIEKEHQQEITKQEQKVDSVIAVNLVLDQHLYKNKASSDSLETIIEADRVKKLKLRNRVYELKRKSFRNVSDSTIIGIFSAIRFDPDSL